MYRLYYAPGACSLAPHIVLEEIGQPYEVELVSNRPASDGMTTASAAWKAINPKGRVPALLGVPGRIGGAENLLTEANAIMTFLARSNPELKLLPADPAKEARCIEWMNWLTTSVHATAYAQIRRPHRFVDDETLYPAIQAKGTKVLRENFGYIDSLLADGREWAVPGGYTIADAYLLVFYGWGKGLSWNMERDFPAWTRHANKVLARPAVQRVIAKEGLTHLSAVSAAPQVR
jgi:glutathione S-transferase